MRGIAIIGVLISHNLILDVWYGRQAFQIVPPWIIGLFFPLLIIFTWTGSFVLISGISTAYTAYRRFEKNISPKKIISPILINSAALLLLDPVRTLVFSRPHLFRGEMTHSIFSKLIMTGQWGLPSPERLYLIGALPMIGLSGLLAALLVLCLFRNEKQRRQTDRHLRGLFIAGFVFSLLTVPLSYAIGPLIEKILSNPSPNYIAAYLLRILGSAQLSFFPMGTYIFFGLAYGLLLASGKEKAEIDKRLQRYASIFFIATLLSIPLVFIFTKQPIRFLANIDIYSPTIIYFSLACITLIFKALVRHVEFGEEEKRLRFAQKTRWIRRFGIMTLTLYIFDAVPGMFVSEWFHYLFGGKALWTPLIESQDAFMTNPLAIIVFVALMFAFWYMMISLWEKSNFAGSFEWLMVKITGLFRKESSRRLDLRNNLDLEDGNPSEAKPPSGNLSSS